MLWRIIPEFPAYEASYEGHIRKIGSSLIRKPIKAKGGYHKITIYIDKRVVTKQLHRLIASAHIPNPEGLEFVNHKDGDKTNNKVSNLEWCTRSENQIHACAIGLVSNRGSKNGFAKLNENSVQQMRTLYNTGTRIKDIAKMFNVKYNTASSIVHYRSWKHVK